MLNKSEVLREVAISIAEVVHEERNVWTVLPTAEQKKFILAAQDAVRTLALSTRPVTGRPGLEPDPEDPVAVKPEPVAMFEPDPPTIPTRGIPIPEHLHRLDVVMKAICDAAGTTPQAVRSTKGRSRSLVVVRRASSWACRHLLNPRPSIPEVSAVVSPLNTEHSAVYLQLHTFVKDAEAVSLVRKACEAMGPEWVERCEAKMKELQPSPAIHMCSE